MSNTLVNCPLCGENADNIEDHVEVAHSSFFCQTCRICSLKKEPETNCIECQQVIGAKVMYNNYFPKTVFLDFQPNNKLLNTKQFGTLLFTIDRI